MAEECAQRNYCRRWVYVEVCSVIGWTFENMNPKRYMWLCHSDLR